MKNSFGNALSVTLFGESHGESIGAVLDGLAPGIKIDTDYIEKCLDRRRPFGRISTARREPDRVELQSGVFNGVTTGTPVCLLIRNTDTRSCDYTETEMLARPGHADYTAECKYHGSQDRRGGGHFSGRVTAALVAAGAIVSLALENRGIYIGTHLLRCAKVDDRHFSALSDDIKKLNDSVFPVLDAVSRKKMTEAIENAASVGDSVGGILETAVIGIDSGIGEPWFDSTEGMLSHILFSIPGIKGVEFGDGFSLCDMRGSEANDPFESRDGHVYTKTNRSGGINGGITNGMPIIFRCAVKPTSSIFTEQETINLNSGENALILLKGRHDPCIAHRARAVVDAAVALCIGDLLIQRYGTDYLGGK